MVRTMAEQEASPSHEGSQVTVVLPHQLRQQAGGTRSLQVTAADVRDAIRAIDRVYPGMAFSICHETGELRRFVNVFVGSESIRYLQGLETPVHQGDVVQIIHSVAGGAT